MIDAEVVVTPEERANWRAWYKLCGECACGDCVARLAAYAYIDALEAENQRLTLQQELADRELEVADELLSERSATIEQLRAELPDDARAPHDDDRVTLRRIRRELYNPRAR